MAHVVTQGINMRLRPQYSDHLRYCCAACACVAQLLNPSHGCSFLNAQSSNDKMLTSDAMSNWIH